MLFPDVCWTVNLEVSITSEVFTFQIPKTLLQIYFVNIYSSIVIQANILSRFCLHVLRGLKTFRKLNF